jgi:hypothetical protein
VKALLIDRSLWLRFSFAQLDGGDDDCAVIASLLIMNIIVRPQKINRI